MAHLQKSLQTKPKRLLIYGSFAILIVILGFLAYTRHFRPSTCQKVLGESEKYAKLPVFSTSELAKYDGIKASTIYLGYHCLVYDVTEGEDQYYGEGKSYHYLVGRDSTKQLEIFGGDIIEEKYPVVGILGE